MTRLIALLVALPLLLAGGIAVADAPLLRIVTNAFVLSGKLDRIAAIGREAGVRVEKVYVETAPGEPAEWMRGADLVVLDTPRPGDLAMVQERIGPAIGLGGAPWIRVGGGPPGFDRLAPDHARRLIAYYANGGEANLRRMFAYVREWHHGGDISVVPAAVPLPKSGFYHPDAPAIFDSLDAYLAWGGERSPEDAPRVGFAIHASSLAGMQTRLADALVAATERRRMMPMVFWFEASAPRALPELLGSAVPDVLVNLHHMQNGPARLEEFAALDVPVLQTISFRQGGSAIWRASTSGVPMQLVAPFLSVTESWGMSDPLVLDAVEGGEPVPIAEQVEALVGKAAALAALRRTPAPEKRLALMFWNHPAGEKNISASHLNVPRSLEQLTAALAAAGYDVPPTGEAALIAAGQDMLGAMYDPGRLDGLLAAGLADVLPVVRYRAWLATLPEAVRSAIVGRWGEPEDSRAVREIGGEPCFVIPRFALGKLVVLPQPPRAGRPGEAYHDVKVPPDHFYLAAYLYLREGHRAHALVHLGTHGTQEWTPGKDRGLWVHDFPFLAVGDLPVFYPYVQDNVAEAIQARRRGRAVVVSHQTPPFAPAGLYDELRDLHALIHEYGQLADGAVRDRTADGIRKAVVAAGLHRDLGWEEAAIASDFAGFMSELHDHLHELAQSAMPLGLHTFGVPAAPEHRLATVVQQLGEPYLRLLDPDPAELFVGDFKSLRETLPFRLLQSHLRDGVPMDEIHDPDVRTQLVRASDLDRNLADTGETEALLSGLAGRFVAPGAGGDPIRNPDVPSGRNLYAFEADKIPTRAAHEAGDQAFRQLLDAYRAEHDGETPRKLAFSLWSSEALRHLGVLESQVLHALGLRPVWDSGGRVTALEIIPSTELGRPRIDVVLQVTSVYRDQFDGLMRLLADAIERIARLDEPGNAIALNSQRLAAELVEQGVAAERAQRLARVRLFGNEPGDYGSGLPEAVRDSAAWDSDAVLAERFLERLQYAYGAGDWGERTEGVNLFAAQLRGVQAAVMSRSSKLHGLLSTDHPFEFLGGLSLAVRHLDGSSPALYVADLRDSRGRVTGAARFLAEELRSRYLNPHWIGGMQAEGYAGTVEILSVVNNLWGWQVTAPDTVRADQWQAVHDTFVGDVRGLGLAAWFEANNPTAHAQVVERLIEAIRKGYWEADPETRRALVERFQELVREHEVELGAGTTQAFIDEIAAGFGLETAIARPALPDTGPPAPSWNEADPGAAAQVRGQLLEPAKEAEGGDPPWRVWLGVVALGCCLLGGAARQLIGNNANKATVRFS